MIEQLNFDDDKQRQIFNDIKERYLSYSNFPKLIVGTGLSINMKVPGMSELADHLDEKFMKSDDVLLKEKWTQARAKIKDQGLEYALAQINDNDEDFVDRIKHLTGEYVLDGECKIHKRIFDEKSGFEKLLRYLADTVSVNNKIIDIMTPNYDRIIELICDKLNLNITSGFMGGIYQNFNEKILQNPFGYYNKDVYLVRLFKPHGSVNWISEDGSEYLTNDCRLLKRKANSINIITPGPMKYKWGLLNNTFRCHREIFNKIITDTSKSFSLIIYGYGFNDPQFDTVFQDTKKDVLVISRSVEARIVERAKNNKNWTLIYKSIKGSEECNTNSFIVHEGNIYTVNSNLWDIDVFVDTFIR